MNIVCDMIKDLTPLHLDGTASRMTDKFVKRHIKKCRSCADFYRLCKSSGNASEMRRSENLMEKEQNRDLIYIPDDGYALIAKRIEKSVRTQRIAAISALIAVAGTAAAIIISMRKSKKN